MVTGNRKEPRVSSQNTCITKEREKKERKVNNIVLQTAVKTLQFCTAPTLWMKKCALCLSTQEAKKKDEKLLKFPEKLQDVQSAAR